MSEHVWLVSGAYEEVLVVEFGFADEHVRVRVRRDGEVALADVLTDPRPGDPKPTPLRLLLGVGPELTLA